MQASADLGIALSILEEVGPALRNQSVGVAVSSSKTNDHGEGGRPGSDLGARSEFLQEAKSMPGEARQVWERLGRQQAESTSIFGAFAKLIGDIREVLREPSPEDSKVNATDGWGIVRGAQPIPAQVKKLQDFASMNDPELRAELASAVQSVAKCRKQMDAAGAQAACSSQNCTPLVSCVCPDDLALFQGEKTYSCSRRFTPQFPPLMSLECGINPRNSESVVTGELDLVVCAEYPLGHDATPRCPIGPPGVAAVLYNDDRFYGRCGSRCPCNVAIIWIDLGRWLLLCAGAAGC